jgi:hypothetical protein
MRDVLRRGARGGQWSHWAQLVDFANFRGASYMAIILYLLQQDDETRPARS